MKILFFAIFLYSSACHQQEVPIENITTTPPVTAADEKYADVFKPLDGKWEGEFRIFVDSRGQVDSLKQPQEISVELMSSLPLREKSSIRVRQEYESITPYFQKVRIWDKYTDDSGEERVVESRGVNKVQGGELWCVVEKPDETVIHSGQLEGEHTLIWQRNERAPLKIEYFRETVEGDEYRIIGWGYYGEDDPELSPRYWFCGKYRRR